MTWRRVYVAEGLFWEDKWMAREIGESLPEAFVAEGLEHFIDDGGRVEGVVADAFCAGVLSETSAYALNQIRMHTRATSSKKATRVTDTSITTPPNNLHPSSSSPLRPSCHNKKEMAEHTV